MYRKGQYVSVIGVFIVKAINEEYAELDPFEKGNIVSTIAYKKNSNTELTEQGRKKEFKDISIGDFFKINGKYQVIKSNEIFTKIKVENYLLSLPNHKLMEVD